MGSKNQGQGHETTFKQILHERLGLDPAEGQYIDGDTDRVAWGMGTMGSRSTVIGGTALWMAADKVIAKGQKIAARLLEAAEGDVTFADGKFSVVGTDRAVALKEVARAAFQPPQLAGRDGARPLRDRHVRAVRAPRGPMAATCARWRSIPTPATS